jgi:hypothetical protein
MITATFNEETEILRGIKLKCWKHHYMTYYWKLFKDFFDYIEG